MCRFEKIQWEVKKFDLEKKRVQEEAAAKVAQASASTHFSFCLRPTAVLLQSYARHHFLHAACILYRNVWMAPSDRTDL